jgi:glucose-1-phosphate cytidylyltransferase
MKAFALHDANDFVVLCGYKGYVIKEFFSNYFLHMSDVTFDFQANEMEIHSRRAEPWKVTLIDTGETTMTGGRLKRARDYLDNERFLFTYGDGVADVDVKKLLSFHDQQGRLATVTGVRPPGRFGALDVDGDSVRSFLEKPIGDGNWINGGFFVLEPEVLDLIEDDSTAWEQEPMTRLAAEGQLSVYKHTGFWQPVDTLRDKEQLTASWLAGALPW